jgi:hypothetical protein
MLAEAADGGSDEAVEQRVEADEAEPGWSFAA